MDQIGEILGLARLEELLNPQMDSLDRTVVRRQSFKDRLRLKGLGCCGPTWGLGPTTTISVMDDEESEQDAEVGPQILEIVNIIEDRNPVNTPTTPPCVGQSPAGGSMNLAAALAAERQFRAVVDSDSSGTGPGFGFGPVVSASPSRPNSVNGPGTPGRVSLMRLLEETDGYDGRRRDEEDMGGCDSVCCVCMGRKKGAAFIPCGHTFCRVCSRELWLNRGSCPLCNRLILEILDLY